MRQVAIPAALVIMLSGCSLIPPGRLGGIAVKVSPEDYAHRLCEHLPLEDYSTCVSQVLDYFDRPRAEPAGAGGSTAGPLVAILDGEVYQGEYSSAPLSARFNISNGAQHCRGSYDAFGGSPDALFDVYCDDGRSGWADLMLGLGGRDGIGRIRLDDGSEGRIVFGYTALGQAEPYPYRP
ncbi:MAG: hypothetical protein JXM75_07055 [Chromatiaceae bacterium]|nr:hypothetical protein [Chromatiaceae bacterium]